MSNVYALAKGGSGKSTTAVTLAHGLALWFGEAYGNPRPQATCFHG